MAEAAPSGMTVDDFLAWAVEQPGRCELENGSVIAMAPESLGHIRAKTTTQHALASAIERAGLACEAVGDGATVRIDAGTAYEPDASVYCGARRPAGTVVLVDPVIVVEIVSPSSGRRDHHEKLIGYVAVPSIRHYLVVDADRRILIHHARRGDEIATRILGAGDLHLDPPGIEVRVEDLFGGPPVEA